MIEVSTCFAAAGIEVLEIDMLPEEEDIDMLAKEQADDTGGFSGRDDQGRRLAVSRWPSGEAASMVSSSAGEVIQVCKPCVRGAGAGYGDERCVVEGISAVCYMRTSEDDPARRPSKSVAVYHELGQHWFRLFSTLNDFLWLYHLLLTANACMQVLHAFTVRRRGDGMDREREREYLKYRTIPPRSLSFSPCLSLSQSPSSPLPLTCSLDFKPLARSLFLSVPLAPALLTSLTRVRGAEP
jgi:hypothetical protein